MVDAHAFESVDVIGDLRGVAGEQAALAVHVLRALIAVPVDAVREVERGGVPACVLCVGSHTPHVVGELIECADWEGRVAAYRIPCVAELGCAAQCRRAFPANPERRVRLLHRLGGKGDVREAAILAIE